MSELLDWKVLYDDGSTFSNLDGEPHEAPRVGVEMVFYLDPDTGVMTEPSFDGYWVWLGSSWRGVDRMGWYDYLANYRGQPMVSLMGRNLPDEKWQGEVRRWIEREMGTPKSAWRKRERVW